MKFIKESKTSTKDGDGGRSSNDDTAKVIDVNFRIIEEEENLND